MVLLFNPAATQKTRKWFNLCDFIIVHTNLIDSSIRPALIKVEKYPLPEQHTLSP